MTRRVLTVDDSPTIRSMIDVILTGAGYEVLSAENGRDGLGMLDVFSFDLIITDLNMHVMGGLSFIRNVRELKRYASVPILVVTTEGSQEIKELGRSYGATGWVTKPFEPEKFLGAVSRVCPIETAKAASG